MVKVSSKDKPFITNELKQLDRKKKREWKRNGKSPRYKNLVKEFKEKYKCAASNFLKKNVSEMKKSKPGKAYSTLKRLGKNPGCEDEDNYFTLTSHAQLNLSVDEQLERISEYFLSIADEFPELIVDDLSPTVKIC